nr:hypothetical protein [Nocardia carnea]
MAGIADPLRQLPDVHAILDVAEVLITENMDSKQLDEYNRQMYHSARVVSRDPAEAPDPEGFDVATEQASFSNFAKMAAAFE